MPLTAKHLVAALALAVAANLIADWLIRRAQRSDGSGW